MNRDYLYGTFLVGFLDIQNLSVISGSQDLDQCVLICTYTLGKTELSRRESKTDGFYPEFLTSQTYVETGYYPFKDTS